MLHIRTGTWAAEHAAARYEKKRTFKMMNRSEFKSLEPAIFISAKLCRSRDTTRQLTVMWAAAGRNCFRFPLVPLPCPRFCCRIQPQDVGWPNWAFMVDSDGLSNKEKKLFRKKTKNVCMNQTVGLRTNWAPGWRDGSLSRIIPLWSIHLQLSMVLRGTFYLSKCVTTLRFYERREGGQSAKPTPANV